MQARDATAAADRDRATQAGDAGAAGGERGFAFACRRTVCVQHPVPAAIAGDVQLETAVHRIAHQPAALALEGHAIEERTLVAIAQHLRPARAAILGAIHARAFAGADAEHDRSRRIETLDVAEVERFGSLRHRDLLPMRTAVQRAQHRALLAAGPGHVRVHRADAAQAHLDSAPLRFDLHPGAGRARERAQHADQQPAGEQAADHASCPRLRTISIAISSACS